MISIFGNCFLLYNYLKSYCINAFWVSLNFFFLVKMNSNLKQNLTKVSNACNDDFFVITNKYVVYKEKVYERREASWTESQLNEESVLRKVGLNKSRNYLVLVISLTFIFSLLLSNI